MMNRDEARALRAIMEKAATSLSDADALTGAALFPAWEHGKGYEAGARLRHGGTLYKVLQAHTSQADWTPDAAPGLFAKVLIPDPESIPAWEQPDSTNPYRAGDRVTHGGKTWTSDVENNTWEPGVYGWTADD